MYSNDIDKLWHTFLLFNKDYELFCQELGQTVYHIPLDPADKKESCPTNCQWTKKAQFIKLYQELYNTEPDTSIWSSLKPCKTICKEQKKTGIKNTTSITQNKNTATSNDDTFITGYLWGNLTSSNNSTHNTHDTHTKNIASTCSSTTSCSSSSCGSSCSSSD